MDPVVGDVANLLTRVGELLGKYLERLQATRERRWDQVTTALDMLTELTALHVKTINEVVSPIIERRDLVETCHRYRVLVNNDDLPRGYGEARGVLESALSLKQFRGGTPETNPLKVVLVRLWEFQHAAFLLKLNSWGIADTLEHAEELWLRLSDQADVTSDLGASELANKVSEDFTTMIDWLRQEQPEASLAGVPELKRPDDVVEATRTWCKGWQRHVQTTLYGGRGLNHAIGALKMRR